MIFSRGEETCIFSLLGILEFSHYFKSGKIGALDEPRRWRGLGTDDVADVISEHTLFR